MVSWETQAKNGRWGDRMDPGHLDELIAIERTYWWHVAKRELVLEVLRRECPPPGLLVEGGLGGGANLLAFQEAGYGVRGFDLMSEAVAHCRQAALPDVHEQDLQEPWPVQPGTARAVVLLDVIEHVPEPTKVLAHAAAALSSDGAVVLTVPANERLMGPWDRMLGHYRRYSRKMLEAEAGKAGLRVAWVSHWNAFTLPAALIVRGREKREGAARTAEFPKVSPTVNRVLIGMARVERRAMRWATLPTGLSLVAVLRR